MAPSPKLQRLLKRTWIGASMIAGLGLVFWAGSTAYGVEAILLVACLLAWGSLLELTRMGLGLERRPPGLSTLALLGSVLWIGKRAAHTPATWAAISELAAQTACCVALAVLSIQLLRRRSSASGGPWRLFLLAWVLLPLPWLGIIRAIYGLPAMAALVLLSKIGDMVGLYIGSWIGRTHPFPSISPGKTTAGCVGSLAGGVLAGGLFGQLGWLPEASAGPWVAFLVGGATNLAAQAGDLFESYVKRRAGAKDSGSLFGPAGGLLDMVDSLLFSVPCALLLWPLVYQTTP